MPAEEGASDLRARPYRDGEEEAVLGLLQASFGGWPGIELQVAPIEHLRWKLDREASPPWEHVVIELDGRLIAFRLTKLRELRAGARLLRSYDGVDVCVHPEYRQRGAYRVARSFEAARAIQRGLDLELSAARAPLLESVAVRDHRRRLGNEIDVLVRPLRLWPARASLTGWARTQRPRWRSAAAYLGRRTERAVGWRPGRVMPEWSRLRVQRFDERIDTFFEAVASEFDLIGVRDAAYLNRRYGDERAGHFDLAVAEADGRVTGFAVVRLMMGAAFVADLLALPERMDVAASLLDAAIALAQAAGASSIACWLPSRHPYSGLLRRAGFTHLRNANVLFTPSPAMEEALAFLEEGSVSLHYTLGDTDLV